MFRRFAYITIISVAAWLPQVAYANPGNPSPWETAKKDSLKTKPVASFPDIDIYASPGTITITCAKTANVKIFSILGRLISSKDLPPGSSTLSLGSHGVYIIKIGEITCKVAI